MKNLLDLFPYLVGVCFALLIWKVTGVVDYPWWAVTAPVWGTYLALLAGFMVWFGLAVAIEGVLYAYQSAKAAKCKSDDDRIILNRLGR